MRRVGPGLVALWLVAVGVLAGCGSAAPREVPSPAGHTAASSPSGTGTASSIGPSAAPSSTAPGESSAAKPPATATAVPLPMTPLRAVSAIGNYSVAWSLYRRGARDTDLIVTVSALACRRLVGAEVDMTATAVTVAVLAGPTRAGVCVDTDEVAFALVRTPEPIGSREIRHAVVGR